MDATVKRKVRSPKGARGQALRPVEPAHESDGAHLELRIWLRLLSCATRIEKALNARLRKVTRNRGQFPSEQAALKVLYLAVRNLEEYRGPHAGTRSSAWKQALQAFTIYFDGRIPTP